MTSRYMSSNSVIAAPAPAGPESPAFRRLCRANGCRAAGSLVDLLHAAHARGEAVDVVGRVVEVEAGAVRRGDAELAHERLAAVVAGADRDAVEVEELGDIVRVRALDVEADDAGALLSRRAVERDARDLAEPIERVPGEEVLVGLDGLEPDGLEILDRGAEPDGLGHRRRSCLELGWQLAPGRLVVADVADHVAAHEERGHRAQQVRPAPQETDPTRPEHLVP